MSKNYFGLLDSRNTKYQGVIRDDHFDGIGILIDEELTTILSTWKKYSINGPSVIIFSSLQIFFGELEKGQPQGVVCCQLNKKQKLLIKYEKDRGTEQQIISLVALISSNQQITYLQTNKDKNEYEIVHNFYSKKQDEILNNLNRILGTQIKNQQIDLNLYLSKNFVDQMEVFQLSGGKQTFFGFKGTNSLGFKLQNCLPVSMGFWNLFPRNLIFGRKVSYNHTYPQKTKIEQGNFQTSQEILTWAKSKGPSIESIKYVEEYFKKSTTFRNQFTKLDQVKKLFKKLKQIQEKVKVETSKKYGQTLLQNNYGSSHDKNDQIIPKEYTLQEVKQQIYKAAAKKHPSFKSSYRSPYQSSFKKQSKYLYEDSNRSRGTYRQEHKVNQFNISYQLRDPFERSVYKEQSFQPTITARKNIKDATLNKVDLLKNVDEIIKKEKQSQQILLNELMKKDQGFNESGQKSPFRQNQEYVSPITKRYRKYELQTGTSGRQKKFQTKTSPFTVGPAIIQKKQDKVINPTRKIKYLQAQKENRPEIRSYKYQNYTIERTESEKEKQKRQRIINFSANQSQQGQSKSHSNLAKYKQRLRDSTPVKQTASKKANRYIYLNQNQNQGEDEIRSSEKLMNQLKLFDAHNQAKSKLQRTYTQKLDFSPQKQRLRYIPSQPRQKLRTTNPFNEDNNSSKGQNRMYKNEHEIIESKRDESLLNDQYKFTKMFSFQDRALSDKINQNPQILQSHKKMRRTFNYVQQ